MRQPACSLVDSIDLILVASNNRLALELHRSSEHVILRCPWVGDECDLLGDLKAHELALLARSQARLAHLRNDVLVLAQALDVGGIDALGLREGLEMGHAGADEGDAEALARVRVAHGDLHVLGYLECVLHLGQCHVLALLELDQVLLAVDDLDLALVGVLANVACAEVANAVEDHKVLFVLLDHFWIRLRVVHEVASTHSRASDQDLATALADAGVVLVGVQVVALGPVAEADARRLLRRANLRRVVVVGDGGQASGSACLGEAVTLAEGCVEARLHKLLHVRREGRGAGEHDAHAAAEQGLDVGEDDLVVEPVGAHLALLVVGEPGVERPLEERLLDG
mmetsp:Transcript_12342/g.36929  ORF Transcript_12342/g.36929 Transcript_12342/m.36929 type:complete len:340 (+) Transcript_12342:210-1229(+)